MEQTYAIEIVQTSDVDNTPLTGSETVIELTDAGIIGLDALCRLCANRSDHLIPIYEGEGLKYQLEFKINTHLPFSVEKTESMPTHCCYQCASTLLTWHELVETSSEADRRLRALQQDAVVHLSQKISSYETIGVAEGDDANSHDPTSSGQDGRVAQSRAAGLFSFRQAQSNFTVDYLSQSFKASPKDKIAVSGVPSDKKFKLSGNTVLRKSLRHKPDQHLDVEQTPVVDVKKEWIKEESDDDKYCDPTEFLTLENKCDTVNGINLPGKHAPTKVVKLKSRKLDRIPIQCEMCNITFKRAVDLKKHLKKHNTEKKEATKVDLVVAKQEVFVSADSNSDDCKDEDIEVPESDLKSESSVFNEGMKSEDERDSADEEIKAGKTTFLCYFCGAHFDSKKDLKDHKEKEHGYKIFTEKLMCRNKLNKDEVNEARVTIDKRTYYQCGECGKNLHSPYTYMWHRRIHTGERPYVCDLCGKQFRVSQGLVRHLRETHAGIKNFPCDLCGRMFATRRNVEEHRRIHTNERPYVCDLCGKAFKQKASLFVHNRSHTDSFPHKCSYCGQGFRTRPPLLVHVTRHTGEKPYPCDVCGRCFRIKYELKRHRLIHSDEKPFSCTECGISFRQKRYLRNHNKINHNNRQTP